jgi:hypothetical protein
MLVAAIGGAIRFLLPVGCAGMGAAIAVPSSAAHIAAAMVLLLIMLPFKENRGEKDLGGAATERARNAGSLSFC